MSQRRFIPFDQAELPLFVGVDLGGTSVKVGVVDDLGRPLSWCNIATEPEAGPESGTVRMAAAVRRAIAESGAPPEHVRRIGLGSPGTMDLPAGMLLDPPNLPGWVDFPIRDRLAHHTGLPVSFENDANAAAYGEFWVGSGRPMRSMVMFTLGTGIGCGVVIDHVVLRGEHSHGAECGHIVIDWHPDAPRCPCGQPGHLEAYCSAKAVTRRAVEALGAGRHSAIAEQASDGEPTPLMLASAAERGDELAREIILDTARYLAVGVLNLIHTIDPSGVVLGGAMTFGGHETAIGREFLETVRSEVGKRTFPVLARKVVIDFAALGADAGFIGAAGIARLEHSRSVG